MSKSKIKRQNKSDYLNICLILTSFLCILFAMVIICKTRYADGYEISLYDVYNWTLWIALAIPMIIPFIVLYKSGNSLSYLALLGSIISLCVLLSLPLFRGYPFYGAGDIYSHLGHIKYIASTGHFGPKNVYPAVHIFYYFISSISGVTPEYLSLYGRQYLIVLSIISLLLFSRTLLLSRRESLIVAAIAAIPIREFWLTREYIMPSEEGFFILPLILYLIIKTRTSKNEFFSIALIPFLIICPYISPELLIFLVIYLFIFFIAFNYQNKLHTYIYPFAITKSKLEIPIFILIIGFFAWFSSTLSFGYFISEIYRIAMMDVLPAESPLVSLSYGFKIGLWDALIKIIYSYGPAILYLLVGGLLSIGILMNLIMKKLSKAPLDQHPLIMPEELILSLLIITSFLLNIFFLLGGTSIGFHIYRQIKYTLLYSTILIARYVYIPFRASGPINFMRLVAFMILCGLAIASPIICVNGLYASPSIHEFNYQPTDKDISGMTKFFDYINKQIKIIELGNRDYQTRFSDYIFGSRQNEMNIRWTFEATFIPYHFGYDLGRTFGSFFSEDVYLLICPPAYNYYQKAYPDYEQFWRYSPKDLALLNMDPSASKFYDNSELKIYYLISDDVPPTSSIPQALGRI
jgi:hypothetical protein